MTLRTVSVPTSLSNCVAQEGEAEGVILHEQTPQHTNPHGNRQLGAREACTYTVEEALEVVVALFHFPLFLFFANTAVRKQSHFDLVNLDDTKVRHTTPCHATQPSPHGMM